MERPPSFHPGHFLTDFLRRSAITHAELAQNIRVPVELIDDIVAGKAAVTNDMAMRLGRALGTTPYFWGRAQAELDVEAALAAAAIDTTSIKRVVPDHKVPHRMYGPTIGGTNIPATLENLRKYFPDFDTPGELSRSIRP